MRIISKFKDYYDAGAAHGIDTTVLYVRDSKEVAIPLSINQLKIPRISREYIVPGLIGYCGKIIPYVAIAQTLPEANRNYMGKTAPYRRYSGLFSTKYIFCYSLAHLDTAISSLEKSIGRKTALHYVTNEKNLKYIYQVKSDLISFLSSNHNSSTLYDYFPSLQIPLFDICFEKNKSDIVLFTNPFLSEMEFFKVKPVITVFQDIMQFISGVLGGNSPAMVHIDDKHQLLKKGFDSKYSFRKLPESKVI